MNSVQIPSEDVNLRRFHPWSSWKLERDCRGKLCVVWIANGFLGRVGRESMNNRFAFSKAVRSHTHFRLCQTWYSENNLDTWYAKFYARKTNASAKSTLSMINT